MRINYSNEDKIVISTIEDINDDVDDLLNEGKSEDIKSYLLKMYELVYLLNRIYLFLIDIHIHLLHFL